MTEDLDREIRFLRSQVADMEQALARLRPDDPGHGVTLVCKTVSAGSYPTSGGVGKVFGVRPQYVIAGDSEGASGTSTDMTGTVYAVNLGPNLPPQNTQVIITRVPYAWVFWY